MTADAQHPCIISPQNRYFTWTVQSLQHGTSLGSGIYLRKSGVGCVSVKKSFSHIRVRRFLVENNKTRNVDSYSLDCETSIFLEARVLMCAWGVYFQETQICSLMLRACRVQKRQL